MRKKIVAGNWKLNKSLDESIQLAKEVSAIIDAEGNDGVDVVVCPTTVNLYAVAQNLSSNVNAGAQNCYDKTSGAYTGEVSAAMAKGVGASHVILGHSERREYFAEDNAFLAAKTDAVLAEGLTPLFCCGETLSQREEEIHFDFVKSQLAESLFHLDADTIKKVVIAYEPIWAIGTGVTASSDQAQEMHKELRDHLATKYGQDVANEISILYGGSCKPSNAQEIFSKADVDGGLIGGAAFVARDFVDIVKAF
jgi:triosephosphate isomerase